MIWMLYYTLMYLMVSGIRLSSLWSSKAKNWIDGRKDLWLLLKSLPPKKTARIWFHVSSLGEFEQARPVIEKLKEQKPDLSIILTFFSPSGYNIRSTYPLATVYYLPADLPGNASHWIELVKPDLAVFVKYDLWPGFLKELQKKAIPTVLISAHWTKRGWFNSWNLPPTRSLLKKLDRIFLQKGDLKDYFKAKGFTNLEIAGDTRIDRSLALPEEASSRLPAFLKGVHSFDLVAGSTWEPDERILSTAIEKLHLSAIIAPHDVSDGNILRLVQSLPFPVTRLSDIRNTDILPRVIIIDSIGLLSVLYSVGKIAYVGGGFGSGIHNTLEPMAHLKPLIFGPTYKKFPEAVEMVHSQGARTIKNVEELISAISLYLQPEAALKASTIGFKYLQENAGASNLVARYLLESIPYSFVQ